MSSGASLKFTVEGDPAPAVKAMRTVTGEAQKSSQSIGASFKKLAGLAGGLFAANTAINFVKGTITAASDLSETVNKSSVIFGENASAVQDWSKTSEQAMGLSQQAALEAASSFGDMFTQIGFTGDQAVGMSEQVVQLAADLGSFNNLSTDDVLDRIAGGFRGEYDALQKLIPNISAARVQQEALNETHKQSVTDLTAAEKATATLNIVMEDGKRASGDFARTSDGLANQQKILSATVEDLQAKIGQDLVPILADAAGALSAVVGWVGKNKTAVEILVGTVGGLWLAYKGYTILRSVAASLSTASAKYSQFVAELSYGNRVQRTASSGLQAIGGAAGKVGSAVAGIAVGSSIGMLTRESGTATKAVGALASTAAGAAIGFSVAGPFGAAIGAGTGLLSNLATTLGGDSEATQKFNADMQDLTATIVDNNGAVNDKARADAAAALEAKGVLEIAEELHFPLSKVTDAALGNKDALNQWTAALANAKAGATDWRSVVDKPLSEASQLNMAGSLSTLANVKDTMDGATVAGHRMAAATDETAGSMKKAAGAISDAGDAASTTKDAVDGLSSAFDKLNGKTIDAAEAEIAWQDSLTAVTKELKGHNKELSLDTKTGRDHLQVVFDSIKAAQDDAQATLERTNSSKKARAAFQADIGTLKQHMIQLGFDKGAVQKLIAEYGRTPKFEVTKFDAQTAAAQQKANSLANTMDALRHAVIIPVHIEQSGSFTLPGSGKKGQASGTSSAPAGWSWVGERGPELMNFRGGERVLSHPQSMRVSRGYAGGTGGGGTMVGPQRVTGRMRLEVDGRGGLWALLDGVVDDKLEHRRTVIGMDH